MEISALLQIEPGITAIIGSGGKTTLMMTLAQELSRRGTVIITTSTKIYPPEGIPVLPGDDEIALQRSLRAAPLLCVASRHPTGKLAAPDISFSRLSELASYVLVEADGSKGLPLKAQAPHEPVIPEESNQVICVVGADGFYKPVREVCHRPEIFSALAGISMDSDAGPAGIAAVIEKEGFSQKVYINKVEKSMDWEYAKIFASCISLPVFAGSLRKGVFQCL